MASVNSNTISGYRLNINVWQHSQNIANNTSVVKYEVRIYCGSGYTDSNQGSWSATINGTKVGSGSGFHFSGANSNILLKSGQMTIPHAADGSKKISFSAIAKNTGAYYSWNGTLSASGNLTLTTIPRASEPKWSKSSYKIGEKMQINMNRKSSSFTHTGTVQIPNKNVIKNFSGVGASWSWTPNDDDIREIYSRMPNSNETEVCFDLQTKSGSKNIGGVKWQNVPLKADTNLIKPQFSQFIFRENNAAAFAVTGDDQILIQNISQLLVTIPVANKMVATYSATAKKYTVSFGGENLSKNFSSDQDVTAKFAKIPNAGAQTILVRAIDSRGNSVQATQDVTVIPYAAPEIFPKIARKNNFENETRLKINGKFAEILVGNAAKNAVDLENGVKFRYKKSGENDFGEWRNLTISTEKGNFAAAEIALDLDNNFAWDFELSVTDKFKTTTKNVTIAAGVPVVFIDEEGFLSVNKMPEKSGRKGIDILPQDKLFDLIYPVGSIYMSVNNVNPANLFGGTWVAFGKGRTIVGVDAAQSEFSEVEKIGGVKTVTLSASQMPKHSHSPSSVGDNWVPNTTAMSRAAFQTGGSRYTLSSDKGQDGWKWGKTGTAGNGNAHNNLPPYIAAYIWKRTA